MYTAAWAKLQATAPGSTCDNARFHDNGDGTVTDRLTGLQWEQKKNDGSVHGEKTFRPVHDMDNLYSWSAGAKGLRRRTARRSRAFWRR